MFVLTTLPDTIPVPLDDVGLPGVVAHVRPLDADELATWFDLYPPGTHQDNIAAVRLSRQQLARVDGLTIQKEGEEPTAFDVKNPLHVRELLRQRKVSGTLFTAILERANLLEIQAGKSGSPSDSPGAQNGATSSAAVAPTDGETSSTADSPAPAASPA